MRAVDIIRKKRDAAELTRDEIEFLIRGATDEFSPGLSACRFPDGCRVARHDYALSSPR